MLALLGLWRQVLARGGLRLPLALCVAYRLLFLQLAYSVDERGLELALAEELAELVSGHHGLCLQMSHSNLLLDQTDGALAIGDESLLHQEVVDFGERHLGYSLVMWRLGGRTWRLTCSSRLLGLFEVGVSDEAGDDLRPPVLDDVVLLAQGWRLPQVTACQQLRLEAQHLPGLPCLSVIRYDDAFSGCGSVMLFHSTAFCFIRSCIIMAIAACRWKDRSELP